MNPNRDDVINKKNQQKQKVLIMAGGTGGHVFPGLALANELLDRNFSVEWLGTEAGLESRLVPEANIHLNIFPVSGIRGKGLKTLLMAPWNILRALFAALKILRFIKPQLVIGMGGFVAGPGAVAAKLTGRPLLIHEQNAVAGTTNSLLNPLANKVISAFPVNLSNAEVLGNPVRTEIQNIPVPKERHIAQGEKINILIVGGSRGALAINKFLPKVFARLAERDQSIHGNIDIWHQAGGNKDESTRALYKEKHIPVKVDAFVNDMPKAYEWADLVICRSGALTVSEIAAVGLASILIPFPYAIDDHQTANANYLVSADAAILIQERDFNEDDFASKLQHLINNREQLLVMANNARALAKPQACETIADRCGELINA